MSDPATAADDPVTTRFQLDVPALRRTLRRRLVALASEDHWVRDAALAKACGRVWSGPADAGGLVGEPWVQHAYPPTTADKTLGDLGVDGRLVDSLAAAGWHRSFALRQHQHDALLAARTAAPDDGRPAVVISAGTGAGKTESFLFPMLDDLMARPPRRAGDGVGAVILYPTNALVNDQVGRLEAYLRGQSHLTVMHYTSETPERWPDLTRSLGEAAEGFEPNPCRVYTRRRGRGQEDAAGGAVIGGPPPDVLVTNYSMLSYMLCRPQDAAFFGPSLRALVLDEAHLYGGTMAAEITLLLRRLRLACGVRPGDVTHYATSATLGGSDEQLRAFIGTVFSRPAAAVMVLTGRSRRPDLGEPWPPEQVASATRIAGADWPAGPTICREGGGATFVENPDDAATLRRLLGLIVDTACLPVGEMAPARLAHAALRHAPLVRRLDGLLDDAGQVPLGLLAGELFADEADAGAATEAAAQLLRLCGLARTEADGEALLPHRVHLMTRAPGGIEICLNGGCAGPEDLRPVGSLGAVQPPGGGKCRHCQSPTLAVRRCDRCGQHVLAGVALPGLGHRAAHSHEQVPQVTHLALEELAGRPRVPLDGGGTAWDVGAACLRCGEGTDKRPAWSPLQSGDGLARSIVAESALLHMPADASPQRDDLPALGRRLLAFSDSRAKAARLDVGLDRQHATQVLRAALVRCVAEQGEASAGDVDDEIAFYETKAAKAQGAEAQRMADQLVELRAKRRQLELGLSVEAWAGLLGKSPAVDGRPMVAQLMDRPTGERQTAADWWKRSWFDENLKAVVADLPVRLAVELGRPSRGGTATLDALGLVEVAYPGLADARPGDAYLGGLSKEAARRDLSESWPDLLAALLDYAREEGCFTTSDDGEEKRYKELAYLPQVVGRWLTTAGEGFGEVRLVGADARHRCNRTATRLLERLGEPCGPDEAAALLRAAFDSLLSLADGRWLRKKDRENKLQVDFRQLVLRRPAAPNRCRVTGQVYPRSVRGLTVTAGACELEATDHATLDADARLGRRRHEYAASPVFEVGLWADEHTAQIDPAEGRRRQELFKLGARNLMSCTTTMELGIDIGGLAGVLLANVPPGRASYLQRAGRAGRRADGSSVVLTHAGDAPFDRAVFADLGGYLARELRPPTVKLDRERIARRHLNAFLLGQFFAAAEGARPDRTGAMDAYNTMGFLFAVAGTRVWQQGNNKPRPDPSGHGYAVAQERWPEAAKNKPLADHFVAYLRQVAQEPDGLENSVAELLVGTPLETIALSPLLNRAADDFERTTKQWRDLYAECMEAWDKVDGLDEPARRRANAMHFQMKSLRQDYVISHLGSVQFLPGFGFPINVKRLQVMRLTENARGLTSAAPDPMFRLERDGLTAVAEYAPGTTLLAGGKYVTSRGVSVAWRQRGDRQSFGRISTYRTCANGHFDYADAGGQDGAAKCGVCGTADGDAPRQMIKLEGHFSTAAYEPPSYGGREQRPGGASRRVLTNGLGGAGSQRRADFAGVGGLSATYNEAGRVLALNEGPAGFGFAICPRCGYAEAEAAMAGPGAAATRSFAFHDDITRVGQMGRGFACDGRTLQPLRNRSLAAEQVTDVLALTPPPSLAGDEALAVTLAHALHAAAGRLLLLDPREIGVSVEKGRDGFEMLFHDAGSGGSGHVRELLDAGGAWLAEAGRVLLVDEAHDRRCERACVDCLITFAAQNDRRVVGLFDRRRTMHVIDAWAAGGGDDAPDPPAVLAEVLARGEAVTTACEHGTVRLHPLNDDPLPESGHALLRDNGEPVLGLVKLMDMGERNGRRMFNLRLAPCSAAGRPTGPGRGGVYDEPTLRSLLIGVESPAGAASS